MHEQPLDGRRSGVITFCFYAFLFLCIYVLTMMVRPVLDDWYFIHQARASSLTAFVSMYYQQGNGRILPNALAYLLLNTHFELWRMLNTCFFMLCAWCAARLFAKKVSKTDYLISLSLLLLLSSLVAREAFFWATGTLNYLWPVTCALLIMIPFADHYTRPETVPPAASWFLMIPALYAGLGNEQVALCTLGFMACFYIFSIYKKRKIPVVLFAISGITLLSFILLLFSPATGVRYQNEIDTAFPGFAELSLGQHVILTVRWMYQRLFVELGIYAFLSYFLLLPSFKQTGGEALSKKRVVYRTLLVVILTMAVAPFILRDYRHEVFTVIEPFAGSLLNKLVGLVPHVFWTVFAATWLVLLYRAKKLYALLLLAACCSLAMMGFSPTIYASGYRTAAVAAVLLCVLLQCQVKNSRFRPVLRICVPSAALVNVIYMLLDNYAWFQRM